MHTGLDNLSDHRGHAEWQQDRFFFSLFPATWKDILHLAHISWIEKTESKSNPEKNKDTHTSSHTPSCACVRLKYTVRVILLLLFVHRCSAAPRVKRVTGWTVERGGSTASKIHKTQTPVPARTTYLETKQIQYWRYDNHVDLCSASVFSVREADTRANTNSYVVSRWLRVLQYRRGWKKKEEVWERRRCRRSFPPFSVRRTPESWHTAFIKRTFPFSVLWKYFTTNQTCTRG